MHPTRGAVLRGLLTIVLLAGLLVVVAWQSEATPQQSPEVEAFLDAVDVDGNGVHTPGDRVVVEWWIANGGNVATAQSNAVSVSNVLSVRAFLESPSAQLNP